MANGSQKNASAKSSEEKRLSVNSRKGLIRRLMRGKDARIRFVDSHLGKGVAFQVQALRGKEGWSQPKLAEKLGTNQNAVYRLENPNYGKQTLTTLKKVAAVFDVALIVRFVPFSQLVDWVSGTPHVDPGLTPTALEAPDFQSEVAAGVFEMPQVVSPDTVRIAGNGEQTRNVAASITTGPHVVTATGHNVGVDDAGGTEASQFQVMAGAQIYGTRRAEARI